MLAALFCIAELQSQPLQLLTFGEVGQDRTILGLGRECVLARSPDNEVEGWRNGSVIGKTSANKIDSSAKSGMIRVELAKSEIRYFDGVESRESPDNIVASVLNQDGTGELFLGSRSILQLQAEVARVVDGSNRDRIAVVTNKLDDVSWPLLTIWTPTKTFSQLIHRENPNAKGKSVNGYEIFNPVSVSPGGAIFGSTSVLPGVPISVSDPLATGFEQYGFGQSPPPRGARAAVLKGNDFEEITLPVKVFNSYAIIGKDERCLILYRTPLPNNSGAIDYELLDLFGIKDGNRFAGITDKLHELLGDKNVLLADTDPATYRALFTDSSRRKYVILNLNGTN